MTDQKPLSEKPLGYALAILGGFLGAPLGLLTSPFTLFILTKSLKPKALGKQPNRFLYWALIGLIGAPISMAISNPEFRKSYQQSADKAKETTKSAVSAPAIQPPGKMEDPPIQEQSTQSMPASNQWNSAAKKELLERSIKEDATLQATGANQPVSSVNCTASYQVNFWDCQIRFLGIPEPVAYRIETGEDGTWAGQEMFPQE